MGYNLLKIIGFFALLGGFIACREEIKSTFPIVDSKVPTFKKVFIIVLENTNADDALKQPFLSSLTKTGAYLNQFFANTHPSQGNYIALTSGDRNGMDDNKIQTVDVMNIVDLLEAKGKSWKEYAEDYPGNCFLEATYKKYARRHAPLISYYNIQTNPERCQKIVPAEELDKDVVNEKLPDYSLYIPNLDNDGHDTGVAFADRWLEKKFGPLFKNPQFMKEMLVVVTFDESWDSENRIYTVLLGDSVIPGSVSQTPYNSYSLLRTIENQFNLGTLGKKDEEASPIKGVWR